MIKLKIPERNENPTMPIKPGIAQITSALEALPLANALESCSQIHNLLKPLNRAPLGLNIRTQIMALILPLIDDLISSVRSTYINSSLPLTEKPDRNTRIIRDLQTELSYGYKIIVHDMLEEQTGMATGSTQLPQSIYYAMSFLSRQLVDTYALYTAEPANIWLELNQLYLYAERQQLHNIELNPLNAKNEPKPPTIANIYRRIVLLSLANPYHLMQGETVLMYKRLQEWAPSCTIIPLGNNTVPEGKLFVDLALDAAPLYAPNTPTKIQPKEGRLFEIKNILNKVNDEVRILTTQIKDTSHSNLAKRMERDMYFRWCESWGIRRERMSHRSSTEIPTQIACSLTLAHHFISGETPFNPEDKEIELQGHDDLNINSASSLSLVPEEHAPWTLESTAQQARRSSSKPRQSTFESDEVQDQKDIWIKVYATSEEVIDEMIKKKRIEYDIYDCQITDSNQGGYGLTCPCRTNPPVRTGEIIAARNNSHGNGWFISTIRWMKVANGTTNMGLRIIADDARPVGVKAAAGIGVGGEYFRALLAPDLDPEKYPTTLIAPAAVYDIDSIVVLNMNDKILYARLTRQLESTNAFSHYQFELVEPPKKIKTTSSDQEERKSSRLFK